MSQLCTYCTFTFQVFCYKWLISSMTMCLHCGWVFPSIGQQTRTNSAWASVLKIEVWPWQPGLDAWVHIQGVGHVCTLGASLSHCPLGQSDRIAKKSFQLFQILAQGQRLYLGLDPQFPVTAMGLLSPRRNQAHNFSMRHGKFKPAFSADVLSDVLWIWSSQCVPNSGANKPTHASC